MIQARGLRRQFGRLVAVEDVSLCVPAGTILALLGPNGAGKTTTVRMLAGLLAPTTGEATVAGFDVRSDPAAVRAHVGLVTDSPGLHDQMTPAAYLQFFGQVYGVEPRCLQDRIAELLDLFDLRAVARTRMGGFSRGMQQKVALARALLHEPSVVFLDEPTAGLDPLAARMVRDLIVGLKSGSRSIVLCTHDLDEAERLADTVAILRRGRIGRKIKVNRTNRERGGEIYRIYLTTDLPYDGVLAKEAEHLGAAVDKLIERFVDWQFTRRDENKFLEVTLRSGRKEILYRSDLISGAIIASIVERAKAIAIKRAIATQQEQGIREMDLQLAFDAEYVENDIFPTTDITEDWLKLIDYDPENVVKIAPVRPLADSAAPPSSGVI